MATLTVTNSVLCDVKNIRKVGFALTQFRRAVFFIPVWKISIR